MTVLILEDEAITAEELRYYGRDVDPTIEVLALLETIDDAVHFLTTHGSPRITSPSTTPFSRVSCRGCGPW